MTPTTGTLQIFIDGAWRDAAALDLTGDIGSGVGAAVFLDETLYRPESVWAMPG